MTDPSETETHKVTWHDSGREPQCPPNPRYPEGIDIDLAVLTREYRSGVTPTCTVKLPYPARRCGYYRIECLACGLTLAVTTAGRPDDPRSVRFPCDREPTQ